MPRWVLLCSPALVLRSTPNPPQEVPDASRDPEGQRKPREPFTLA